MINKIKALGLAFVAITAMSAVAASAAQAGALDFSAANPVVTGTNHVAGSSVNLTIPLSPGPGTLQSICTNATFEGTVTAAANTPVTEATVTATYSGCKVNGLAAVVRMNGCKYILTGNKAVGAHPAGTATIDVTGCTAGKQIEIEQTPTGCVISVPQQHSLSHVVAVKTSQQTKDVDLEATVTGITNTQGAGCPNPGVHQQNAAFIGNTTLQSFVDEGQTQQVTQHGHQFAQVKHTGVETTITVT